MYRQGRADAILTADIHLRATNPVCRIDDYFAAQKKKLLWLKELQKEHGCPILDAGDMFDSWKSTPEVEAWAINTFRGMNIYTVIGNHEMPYHNSTLFERSSLAVLEAAQVVRVMRGDVGTYGFEKDFDIMGCAYGETYAQELHRSGCKSILLMHRMVTPEKHPIFESETPEEIFAKYPYDLIVTGHNHDSFIAYSKDGRVLVNPGSLMRSNATQIDYKPRVFLWYAKENDVIGVDVPIEKDVFDLTYIETKKESNKRIEAFVDGLCADEIDLSFEKTLENMLDKNNVRNGIREKVMEAIA